ncbi:amino acid/amide ABC transporter ATP-binding protein 2, HAAT family [Gemmobacter megaterium]|uniref:Amino acid/amide ABC transporter ATP-binding protein 2, HAAT family n=1 Tax=Gemmobacter megaterium TaxID=1086013 RepID=A0A1N7NYK6_9RHOB|nr:ABC transporter ATP-binding protein [Gemmobacter megaterium]GGE15793.1 ABC transporter ATP-binding protein [Gemmobacter megaterium]SIT03404.1 amino acid/amide ABC transporter ATP-binding protein 2, HAAT family [Gemmobacter megaterium]
MTDVLLSVHDLSVAYGQVQVLFGVDLAVARGSVTTLIGANGAGKTTLMKTLAGMVAPRSGTVLFQGRDIAHLPSHARVDGGLALIPEGRLVFGGMTVEQNLRLGAIAPSARAGHDEMLAEVYRRFPRLQERRHQRAGLMSGGEQQMLALGRGLMARPRLILMDEPTLGLAPVMVRKVFDTIAELRAAGFTILLAEQNARVALEIADHATLLENGRIAMTGTGAELLAAPAVRRAYLGL